MTKVVKKTEVAKTNAKNDAVSTIVETADTIFKHQEKLKAYTKNYKWLENYEQKLLDVVKKYEENKKALEKNKEAIFNEDIKGFDYKIIITDSDSSYINNDDLKINKAEIVGAFAFALLGFVRDEKSKTFANMEKAEKAYAEELLKK